MRLASSAFVIVAACAQAAADQWMPIPNSLRHPEAVGMTPSPVSSSDHVFFAVSLAPRDLAGLQKYAQMVSDPSSIYYRQFLTPDEVGLRFGPAQGDIASTVSFLTSQGLTVDEVSKNGFVITAEGTAAQVEQAFQTQLVTVNRVDGSGSYRTNLTTLEAPSSIASKIVSVDGVDTSIRRVRRAYTTTTLNPTLYRGANLGSTLYSAGWYGQGVNIGISNWDGYRLSNIPLWCSKYSLPTPAGGAGSNITIREVGTGPTYGQGSPAGEGDLDLQAVLMAAPLCNLYDYDDATSDSAAPITTLSAESSDNIIDVCTESYGWETASGGTYYGPTWTSAYNIHLSMAAQGITYMAATGDNGTSAFPKSGTRYAYPDIDPTVLQVGGSTITVLTSNGTLEQEASWGLKGGYGGTGGFDPYDTSAHGFAFNVLPSYQSSLPSGDTKYPYRLLPDIANLAAGEDGLGNNTGTSGWALNIYYNGSLIAIDGTSIASPATAGSVGAVMNELFSSVTPNPTRSNVRLGELQPFLYANGSNSNMLFDIVVGNSVGNLPGTTTAARPVKGWDFATGWGSFKYPGLESALVSAGF
jgi:subtilase family serine protease